MAFKSALEGWIDYVLYEPESKWKTFTVLTVAVISLFALGVVVFGLTVMILSLFEGGG